jgi:hypothetical protein
MPNSTLRIERYHFLVGDISMTALNEPRLRPRLPIISSPIGAWKLRVRERALVTCASSDFSDVVFSNSMNVLECLSLHCPVKNRRGDKRSESMDQLPGT